MLKGKILPLSDSVIEHLRSASAFSKSEKAQFRLKAIKFSKKHIDDRIQRGERMNWVKVKFLDKQRKTNLFKEGRFCEFVYQAMVNNRETILNKGNINCEGARIAFSWQKDFHDFEQKFSSNNKVNIDLIDRVLKNIQASNTKNIKSIILNGEEADVVVSFALPKDVMEISRLYFVHTGEILKTKLRPFLSICLQTVVAWEANYPTVSCGCKDSRLYSGIKNEELIVAFPYSMYKKILKENIA